MEIECACGCGELIPEFNKQGKKRKFVNGHHRRGKNYHEMKKHRKIPCACGCGELIPEYNHLSKKHRFVQGHNSKDKNNSNRGKKHSKESKLKMSIALKGKYSGKNSCNYGKKMSEESRKKLSESRKGKYAGENSPAWQGGISFEPYCPKFNEAFKEKIREMYNRRCFWCGKTEIENDNKLSVHHTNYDKNCLCNDIKCEFVPLCNSCHGKTSRGDREYWEKEIISRLFIYEQFW